MAEQDAQAVTPEIRIARLLSHRRQLQPPVPVHELLKTYADVRQEKIPGSVDGLVYYLRPAAKPRVILNSLTANRNRERFTVAHELGHIILPWHCGAVFCHTDETLMTEDSVYQEIEAEANRFAGELLVPTEWARSVVRSHTGDLAECVINIAAIAEVSPMVAAFSVANTVEGVMLFVTCNGTTMMSLFGTILGRWSKKEWSKTLEDEYKSMGAKCSSRPFGPYSIHCVEFQEVAIGKRPKLPSTEVLEIILWRTVKSVKERVRLAAIVNGVIGSANMRTPAATVREFMIALRHRFIGRPELNAILRHSRFDEFLLAKSYELAEKKRSR